MKTEKPLNKKAYGSIPHLPGSKTGPGEYCVEEGMERLATQKLRDKWDRVYIQEKLDGSNCSIALLNGELIPLTRRGYPALSSPFEQHHMFDAWVHHNSSRFLSMLKEGERACGEWLVQAHGTLYDLTGREPFVLFDILTGIKRIPVEELHERGKEFTQPFVLSTEPISIEEALRRLGPFGHHGAREQPEGAVWRVERLPERTRGEGASEVLFLVKYVRPDKVDGKYFDPLTWNIEPKDFWSSSWAGSPRPPKASLGE